MKKTNLIAALTLMSSLSFADVKPVETSNQLEMDKEIKKISKSVRDDSAANREGKNFNINASPFGLGFSASAVSLEGNYFINSKSTVGLQISSLGNESRDDTNSSAEDKIWDEHGEGTAVELSYKRYVSNSFYVKPSMYHRSQYLVQSTTTYGGTLIDADYADIEDMGVSVSIGNQWQWDNFTLGTDWVGFSKSVSILDQDGTIEYSENDLNSLKLLNFYAGYTF